MRLAQSGQLELRVLTVRCRGQPGRQELLVPQAKRALQVLREREGLQVLREHQVEGLQGRQVLRGRAGPQGRVEADPAQ